MTDDYAVYLQSEQWKHIRQMRIKLSEEKCEICASPHRLHVHHLTYERIFREAMDDLMSLCELCHASVEAAIAGKIIPRVGDVARLRSMSVSIIRAEQGLAEPRRPLRVARPRKERKARKPREITRNQGQAHLMSQQWFTAALKLPRDQFKKIARSMISGRKRNRGLSNAFALYDRLKRRKVT